MNKLDRKYITLNAVNGNNDAYCSVSFDFTGAKEKVSLSVNGESCETQSFYVVVKEGASFSGFYLGDLNKKAENKYEFKKDGCKLGNSIYTLKDVVAVQIVDNIYKQVLYDGIVDDSVGYKGVYKIVVDKPIIVRSELAYREFDDKNCVDKLDFDEVVAPEENMRGVKEENGHVEEVESTREEKEIVEEVESAREEKELVEEVEDAREEIELAEEVENSSEENLYNRSDSDDLADELDINSSADVTDDELLDNSDILGYGESLNDRLSSLCNAKANFEDLVDVEQCEMDCSDVVDNDSCGTCEYKLFYTEYERHVQEVNDDFQVFNELYSRYLRNEFNENYSEIKAKTIRNNTSNDDNYRHINENSNNQFDGNIEFKNYQNFVEFERLKPNTEKYRDNNTKVINSTFRGSVDKGIEEEKGNSDDFYQQLIGDNKNKKTNNNNNTKKSSNKNTSFVDIFNYVKQEFDSIKEIMSLSDEEFAKRSEKEFKTEKNQKSKNVDNSRTKDIKRVSSLRSLIEERVEFKPFEMEEHCVRWVQIKLNEVVGLFDEHWKLFWEPFVVDAYKEAKHLLLGFEEVDGKDVYFFAVPTVYNKENTDKAYELGFEFFEVVGDNFGEITDGANGYFIKELKQDDVVEENLSNKADSYTYGTKTKVKADMNGTSEKTVNNNENTIDSNVVQTEESTNDKNQEVDEQMNTDINGDSTENATEDTNVDYENLDDIQAEDMDSKGENTANEYNIKVGKNISGDIQ